MDENHVNVSTMIGETCVHIAGMDIASDLITFTMQSGRIFTLKHNQDCCEAVEVEDVIGYPETLLGTPILVAEERSNSTDPLPPNSWEDSYTWTFYTFATVKGFVTLRWLGQSNGYYSESVDCYLTEPSTPLIEEGR